MKLPSNWGGRAPHGHLLSSNETANTVTGVYLIELFLNTPCFANIIVYFPQTESKAPLLRTTPTQPIEHGGVELGPMQSLHHSVLVSSYKGALQTTKSEAQTPTQPQTL